MHLKAAFVGEPNFITVSKQKSYRRKKYETVHDD